MIDTLIEEVLDDIKMLYHLLRCDPMEAQAFFSKRYWHVEPRVVGNRFTLTLYSTMGDVYNVADRYQLQVVGRLAEDGRPGDARVLIIKAKGELLGNEVLYTDETRENRTDMNEHALQFARCFYYPAKNERVPCR